MKYNGNNLKEVLEAHRRWLDESEGWSEEDRADMSGADLNGVDLNRVDLSKADMTGANLIEADLRRAYLIGADLRGAYLIGADLRGADLRGAYLIGANLRGACLREANLNCVHLNGAESIPFIPLACPDTGAFVAWKVCNLKNGPVIVKLLIPDNARRSSGSGRKCRADRAVVLEIQTVNGDALEGVIAWSFYDNDFTYEVGKIVTPKEPFCEDRFNECASGIHFFINRQEAIEYY